MKYTATIEVFFVTLIKSEWKLNHVYICDPISNNGPANRLKLTSLIINNLQPWQQNIAFLIC